MATAKHQRAALQVASKTMKMSSKHLAVVVVPVAICGVTLVPVYQLVIALVARRSAKSSRQEELKNRKAVAKYVNAWTMNTSVITHDAITPGRRPPLMSAGISQS